MIILGIESSCDETAAAVVKDGKEILSSVVSSQVAVHHKYGGVVPELASRMHIESIIPVVTDAVNSAGITIEQIEGVAATRGPGLIGALLVGFSFAKAFSWARDVPWTGVNHLEGHIYSVFLTDAPPEFPFVILLASGGHTNIYYVTSYDEFELMGQTRDDAAGEAFDKVAKMLGLGYPGGAVIERLAKKGDPSVISFPKSYLEKDSFDFSFSGIKSAVARYIHEHGGSGLNCFAVDNNENMAANIAAAFQESVVEVLAQKLINAALLKKVKHIAVAGGVAANSALKRKLLSYIYYPSFCGLSDKSDLTKSKVVGANELKLHLPPISLCGDNAAMVAARGYRMIKEERLCHFNHDVFSRTRI